MARIRWHGQEFIADPVRQLENGNWIMTAREHGARFTVGTEIEVKPGEIVEMAAAEAPAADESQAKLEAAMAEERKTLPSVQELLKKGGDIKHDAPDKVEVSNGPQAEAQGEAQSG